MNPRPCRPGMCADMQRPVAAVAVVCLVVLGAACSAPAPESPVPSAAGVEPPSSAAPTGGAGPLELVATGAPLPPGRYASPGFEPLVTFELNDDWQAVQQAEGFFDVQQRVGTPDVIAVQFANVLGVYGPEGTATVPDTHEDAAAILGTHPGLEVVEASESRIGGLVGSQVTVENAGDSHASVLEVSAGALGIDPGRRLWIALFDTEAGVLAIMVGGSVAEWQAALDAAEPVLESIQIGG
jgi:hypothetical protein